MDKDIVEDLATIISIGTFFFLVFGFILFLVIEIVKEEEQRNGKRKK